MEYRDTITYAYIYILSTSLQRLHMQSPLLFFQIHLLYILLRISQNYSFESFLLFSNYAAKSLIAIEHYNTQKHMIAIINN